MRLHSCRLQYNQIDQTCSHNQDIIEICSAQQARAGEELLYRMLSRLLADLDLCAHLSNAETSTALITCRSEDMTAYQT